MRLRPHHILCMKFFVGKGYNGQFVENMANIISALRENPLCAVELSPSADCICAKCPNNADSLCVSDEKVSRYDEAVLDLCGLELYKAYSFDYISLAVTEQIIIRDKLAEVCGGCEWHNLCESVLEKRRR